MRKKQGAGGWMAIKVDLEKAFDRLKWDFIKDTIQDAGLPNNMIRVIMECITSSSMQILWNGRPGRDFRPQRGIRQGAPLSPYIFVLCMDRLSQAINKEVSLGTWKPIKIGHRGVPLSHLFFADDLIIFGHTIERQVQIIKKVLADLCGSSGHKISLSKTKVYFSRNVNVGVKRNIANSLGFQPTCSIGKYMGVPLITGRVSSATYK